MHQPIQRWTHQPIQRWTHRSIQRPAARDNPTATGRCRAVIGPANPWEHVEMRLRRGPLRLEVTPVQFVSSMGTSYTDPAPAEKANGFEVALHTGPAETEGHSLATFADVQEAWEFAAITTHYLEARSPEALTSRIGDSREGSRQPGGLITDRSPLSVFEDLVGHDTEPIERFLE